MRFDRVLFKQDLMTVIGQAVEVCSKLKPPDERKPWEYPTTVTGLYTHRIIIVYYPYDPANWERVYEAFTEAVYGLAMLDSRTTPIVVEQGLLQHV
jgi:hypothetical protein